MELSLIEICEKIASSSAKSHNKPDLYDSASEIINTFLTNEVPSNFLLTGQAVQNIQSDLTARDEVLKVSASHLFLTLVQLSKTLSPDMAHGPNSWTVPIQIFALNIRYLVKTCFPLLGSTNIISQQKSLSVVVQHIEAIKAWSDQTNVEAHSMLTNLIEMRILPRLENMLGEPEREELLAMKIWQQLIHSIGNYIPKTNHELINRLLKLIEFCFKNTRQEVQLCAYASWSILIKTFSLHPTYLVKKLRLFNVPLLSCAVKQEHRYAAVDVERAKTWSQLMVSLTPELRDHASTVCTPYFFFCIGLDPKITAINKFNEGFKTYFKSFIDDNIILVERSWNASFIDSNINFLNVLSGPNNSQHLPKKALSDPQTLYDWRAQLCLQGIQSLAALVQTEEPSSHLARYAVFNEISADLWQFSSNANYLDARDDWVRENHRVLLTLIGLSIHLFDPIDGPIVAECFRRILDIMTSLYHTNDQLLYSLLAVCQTALAKRHNVNVIVSLVASIHNTFHRQVSVPIHESSDCTIAHLLIEILLDPQVLSFEETLPESFYNSYQTLLSCRNLRTIGLNDFQHFLTKLDTSNNDPTSLWRGWQLTARGLLLAMQSSTYAITGNTPDFSACCFTLSFVFTRIKRAPCPDSVVRESSDVWKKLFNRTLELISIDERNQFINTLSRHINYINESLLHIPDYTHFLTLLLDELVSRLSLSYSLVYSATGVLCSIDSPSLDLSDKLGNITFCVSALSKLLNFAHSTLQPELTNVDTDGHTIAMEQLTDSSPVSNLLTTTIYIFSHMTNPILIQNVCTYLSHPIGLYIETAASPASADSPQSANSIAGLLARLWEVIKAAILANFEVPYSTEFLLIICPILLPIFYSSNTSILSSACDFFTKTFATCTEDIDFPDSLKRALTSQPVREIMEQHSHTDGLATGKTAKKKLEDRDSSVTTPSSKKFKPNVNEPSPLPNNNQDSHTITESVTSNDPMIGTEPRAVISPCEEDPLSVSEAPITVSDEDPIFNSGTNTETSPRLTGAALEASGSCRFSRSPSNFYSDQKTRFKQSKFIKISDTDKYKSKSNWQHSPNDKEKKAFFKLELTPIKLEELPKSSPTHQSVSRRLQFPADGKILEEIYDQETVSLPRNSPDVEILGLGTQPVDEHTAPARQQPSLDLNSLEKAELDSVDEFIKNIPLSDIVSPDEMQAMQFADTKSAEEAVDSEGTGSLMSITSSSVSQSVTPPFSGVENPPHTETEAESILAFNECILASEESTPIDSDQTLIECSEPMEIPNEFIETELENNVSTDSIPPDQNTSALLKDNSPDQTSGPSSNQSNTPKQSILKKQSTSSPSPSFKKVSFANPIHETHAISISPRAKKLRAQRQSSSSKLTSATTSIGTRRGTRLGSIVSLFSNPDDPICKSLVECSEPVDKLIPFLASQFVSRGIAGLLKAKKIETIGDLAKLNEREAENLPIQPPKMLTLRTAFSKYQVTQFGITGDLTRQESHPLFFPLTRSAGTEIEEDTVERGQDDVAPVEVAELPDVEFVNSTEPDCVAVSIQEYPLGEIDTAPELVCAGCQTESVSSVSLIQEMEDSLPRDIPGLSQTELTHMLTSLCQLIPSIAEELNNK